MSAISTQDLLEVESHTKLHSVVETRYIATADDPQDGEETSPSVPPQYAGIRSSPRLVFTVCEMASDRRHDELLT